MSCSLLIESSPGGNSKNNWWGRLGLHIWIRKLVRIKEAEKWKYITKFGSQKINSSVIKKPQRLWDLTYFNKVKFIGNFRSSSETWITKQDGRYVAMVTKDLQTLNLKFDQVMFNSLVLTWERNFEVTFSIFSVLVFQINVLWSYLHIYLF